MPDPEPKKRKTSISLRSDVFEAAEKRYHELGYPSFSAYLEFLIQSDDQSDAEHQVVRDAEGTHYRVTPKRYSEKN